MNLPIDLQTVALAALLLILLLLSLIEHSVSLPGRLSLRVLAEKDTHRFQALVTRVAVDRRRFLLPIQFGIQMTLVFAAVLLAQRPLGLLPTLAAVAVMVLVFRQLIPRWLARNPEKVLLRVAPLLLVIHPLLDVLSWPLRIAFRGGGPENGDRDGNEDEATEEEIQAYLGVGEEEGLFEADETRLIQSALEFSSTLVREIMTPRSEVVAIDDDATVGQLRELIVSSKHSRIPVYRDQMDQIIGVVYVRNLLSKLDSGLEDEPITSLIHEPMFVPETKRVAELLKEMQTGAEHMAVVVNEYGAVSGIVTIEDLLEEIVGEIHDEDETQRVDLIDEGGGSYVVRGGLEIEELEQALGRDLGDHEVTTVSGLVVAHLGHVPISGDRIRVNGLEAEILSADEKKIHTLRIRLSPGPAGDRADA